MNEYLFRGKTYSGVWTYGHHVKYDNPFYHEPCGDYISRGNGEQFLVLSDSVGLRAGLTDANDTEVFEGDVIEYMGCDGRYVGVVRFGRHKTTDGHEYIGFYVDWSKGLHAEYFRNDLAYWIEKAGAVVIGNETDSPELLEVKHDG